MFVEPQVELLITHREKVEKAVTLDMTWLAHEMNKTGLLPSHIHEDVVNTRSMLTEAQKATKIVGVLKTFVEINPKNLDKFIDNSRRKHCFMMF